MPERRYLNPDNCCVLLLLFVIVGDRLVRTRGRDRHLVVHSKDRHIVE